MQESPEQLAAIERDIDTIVFHAYGLSASERKLVLDWLGERREALGDEMPTGWRKLNTLRATAGAWRDSIDGEQLKRDIRASRDIRTRPIPQLLEVSALEYLLDTDWAIDYLHKADRTVRRLEELLAAGIGISIVSLAELYDGLAWDRKIRMMMPRHYACSCK